MPQLEAAGQRAVTWRVHCARVAGANSEILNGIAFTSKPEDLTTPDREGWRRIGWVADPWVGSSLRVFWKPFSDQVRMDRPTQRKGHCEPAEQKQASSARADGKVRYVVVIRVPDDGTVTLEVRPLYSGEPQVRTRHMRVGVPSDENEYFA